MAELTRPPLRIGDVEVEGGRRIETWLPVGSWPDGLPLGLPLIVVSGRRPGPRLMVTAGIHGDEYEGPEALRQFLADLDPDGLSGCVAGVIQANPAAYAAFARTSPVDGLDLNRSFPGSRDGPLTERLAHLLAVDLLPQFDALVDLHSGGLLYGLSPYVGFHAAPGALGEASFAMAKAFGIPTLYASTPFPHVMRLEAARRGIPAILVEAGDEGRLRAEPLALTLRGLHGVARHLGILPGDVASGVPMTVLRAAASGEFLRSPAGGFLRSACALGADVLVGARLGSLHDVFGHTLAEITAPHAGRVMEMRTVPVTRTGDWTYAVLPEVCRIDRDTPLAHVLARLEEATT